MSKTALSHKFVLHPRRVVGEHNPVADGIRDIREIAGGIIPVNRVGLGRAPAVGQPGVGVVSIEKSVGSEAKGRGSNSLRTRAHIPRTPFAALTGDCSPWLRAPHAERKNEEHAQNADGPFEDLECIVRGMAQYTVPQVCSALDYPAQQDPEGNEADGRPEGPGYRVQVEVGSRSDDDDHAR